MIQQLQWNTLEQRRHISCLIVIVTPVQNATLPCSCLSSYQPWQASHSNDPEQHTTIPPEQVQAHAMPECRTQLYQNASFPTPRTVTASVRLWSSYHPAWNVFPGIILASSKLYDYLHVFCNLYARSLWTCTTTQVSTAQDQDAAPWLVQSTRCHYHDYYPDCWILSSTGVEVEVVRQKYEKDHWSVCKLCVTVN